MARVVVEDGGREGVTGADGGGLVFVVVADGVEDVGDHLGGGGVVSVGWEGGGGGGTKVPVGC